MNYHLKHNKLLSQVFKFFLDTPLKGTCQNQRRWITSIKNSEKNENLIEEEFDQLDIIPEKRDYFIRRSFKNIFGGAATPRSSKMSTTQDWSSVWPTQRMFHPGTCPLPIYQGYVRTSSEIKPKIERWNNPELMKIPNFLHLSPVTIKKQTEVLKNFCTDWPSGLETDDKCKKHFPLKVITTDRIFSSFSIRDEKARIVKIKFDLDCLKLDEHARLKMIQLLDKRYNKETNEVIIITDSCPFKKQNFEYALYLLTATFFESWKTEPWEIENK